MEHKKVRTRFAPSPTGYMHVGGVRTALFAWLVARQNKGEFILRLEDTDKTREVEGSGDHIIKSLKWLGIDWDEGFDKAGKYGSYKQSDRLDTYKQWANKLIEAGRAYADPYSPEEVQSFREQAIKDKKPFLYRNFRPENPPKWDGTQPLRFKSDPKKYTWNDEVMGELQTGPEVVDDFILIKSDGYPTYNFAHIVDDAEMEITHIIRSQEFLASVPNYLNLYEALGLTPPVLATVPPVLGPAGSKKLSKRDGAKDILEYQKEGYLPQALINFLASLGWNDGTEQEIFTISELIEKFHLNQIQKSGARFDEQRLLWMNGAHIRMLDVNDLYDRSKSYYPESSKQYPEDYKKKVLALLQERLKYFAEIPVLSAFFFEDLPVDASLIENNKQLKKFSKDELKTMLEQTNSKLENAVFETENLTKILNEFLEETNQKPGVLFSLIRIATTQAPASPALAETLALLGKDVVMRRLKQQLSHF